MRVRTNQRAGKNTFAAMSGIDVKVDWRIRPAGALSVASQVETPPPREKP